MVVLSSGDAVLARKGMHYVINATPGAKLAINSLRPDQLYESWQAGRHMLWRSLPLKHARVYLFRVAQQMAILVCDDRRSRCDVL